MQPTGVKMVAASQAFATTLQQESLMRGGSGTESQMGQAGIQSTLFIE